MVNDIDLDATWNARMNQIAVNELTTYRWSFEDDVRHYAANGITAIGVWREKLSDFGEDQGCQLLLEHGLGVSSLMWAGGFTGSDGRTFRESVVDALDATMLAAQLEASCLIVYSGARGGHTRNHAWRLFRSALDKILPFAEEHGVVLAVEPMPASCGTDFTFLNGIDESTQLIDEYDSQHLKLALDTYCLADEPVGFARLTELASQIAIVQLGDAKEPPLGEPNRCFLGEGVLQLDAVVDALSLGGYDGFWEIELLGEDLETADYHEILKCSKDALGHMLRHRSP
jgi:sugar phosphate isomerase/epimerase